jgi:hypothetical protein
MDPNATCTTLTIGSGTGIATIKGVKLFTLTLSPASVLSGLTGEQTFTCTGLATTDQILSVTKPTAQAGLGIVGSRVVSANTIGITFVNTTVLSILPTAAQAYTVVALAF